MRCGRSVLNGIGSRDSNLCAMPYPWTESSSSGTRSPIVWLEVSAHCVTRALLVRHLTHANQDGLATPCNSMWPYTSPGV